MKLRLRENSIRLRLLKSEIELLRKSGSVSKKILFSQSQFLSYTLKISNDAAEISACFEEKEITVVVPSATAREWTETNLVGLEREQAIGENSTLKISIEKDFVCLERPLDADNADSFPHPNMNCA